MPPPVRVLNIITGSTVGGAEHSLSRLCQQTDRRKVTHSILTLKPPGPLFATFARNAQTVSLHLERPAQFPGSIAKLRRAVKSFNPHVVQGWLKHGNLAAYLATQGTPRALFWNLRNINLRSQRDFSARAIARFNRAAIHRVHTLISNSEAALAQLNTDGSDLRTIVIPNGYDLAQWNRRCGANDDVLRRWKMRLNIPARSSVVGFFRRNHPEKGTTLLRKLLRQRQNDTSLGQNVHFILVGSGFPDKSFELPNVTQHPAVSLDDLAVLYRICDVTILPSLSEGFPNAVCESLLCRTPVIAADVGDAARALGPGGMLVQDHSVQAWRESLHDFLSRPAEGRRAVGDAGHAYVAEHFDIHRVVNMYTQAYQSAQEPHAGPSSP